MLKRFGARVERSFIIDNGDLLVYRDHHPNAKVKAGCTGLEVIQTRSTTDYCLGQSLEVGVENSAKKGSQLVASRDNFMPPSLSRRSIT